MRDFSIAALTIALAIAGSAQSSIAKAATDQSKTASPQSETKITNSDDIFLKCSVMINGTPVITRSKFEALADNIADSSFAAFDPLCKGKKNNPEGVVRAGKKMRDATGRLVHDMNDVVAERATVPGTTSAGIPAEVARTDFGKTKTPTIPFLFRDAYSTYSLLNPPPPRERATGTQISYTEDYHNHNTVISAVGAIIGWDVLSVKAGSDNPLASMGVTRMLWAPGVEFDQVRNQNDRTKNMDYIGFRIIGELEKETAGGLFPLQYFRFSPYLKTDSFGSSKITGAYAEWEPYRLEWAIGVARRLYDSPIQFRWSPIIHAEAERVIDAGAVTGIHTGDNYARGGPILSGDIFFAEGPLQHLVLNAQYRYLWNVSDTGRAGDIRYFQTSAAYNLDDSGIAALSVTYRDGNTPGNNTRVQDLKTGLTVKY